MNKEQITRKEFLAITGGVMVLLFGGIPSKIIKTVSAPKKQIKVASNSTYGGIKTRSLKTIN